MKAVEELQKGITDSLVDINNQIDALPKIRLSLKSQVDEHFQQLIDALNSRKNSLHLKTDEQIDFLNRSLETEKQKAITNSQICTQVINFSSQLSQLSPDIAAGNLENLKFLLVVGGAAVPVMKMVFSGTLVKEINQEGEFVIEQLATGQVKTEHTRQVRTGQVSIVAGSGQSGYKEGTGIEAVFNSPVGVAINSKDNSLYIADLYNHRIRKITAQGQVSTFCGSGEKGRSDGISSSAMFNCPRSIAVYRTTGDLYVSDGGNNQIHKITPQGIVSTIAGSGSPGNSDGNGLAASFDYPCGIDVDQKDGSIYIADSSHRIRKISSEGEVTTIAGSSIGFKDGNLNDAQFQYPVGICVDPSNSDIYVADNGNNRIRKISSGVVSTVAGTGRAGCNDGDCAVATFNLPHDIKVSSDHSLLVADFESNKIRKISGVKVTTISPVDENSVSTSFCYPISLGIDQNYHICYVVESSNHRISKLYLE